jgi:hypothetical protein
VGAFVERVEGERLLGGGECAGGVPVVEAEVAELLEEAGGDAPGDGESPTD